MENSAIVAKMALVAGLSFVLTAGCGTSTTGDRVHTVPVGGTVMYQGRPLADAVVSFVPESPSGRGAFGRTDSAGKFRMMTVVPGDGAVPGKYKVTVTKGAVESKPEPTAATGDQDYSDPETSKPAPAPIPLVPPKYSTASSTPLTATVENGKPQELTFELKD